MANLLKSIFSALWLAIFAFAAPAAAHPENPRPHIHTDPMSCLFAQALFGGECATDQEMSSRNQRENKQIDDIANRLGLTRDQRQRLHREITGQGLSYEEILQIARDMFNR